MNEPIHIVFTLNNAPARYQGEGRLPLLSYLRDELNITSVKDGCSNQGACGACMVEMNGKPTLSCKIPMSRVENAEITTIDGFPPHIRETLAHAFIQNGAVQCGYCSPGMLTRAKLLLETHPYPTRLQIAKALKTNYCRCTGYHKIITAIFEAAEMLRAHTSAPGWAAEVSHRDLARLPKYKGYEKALGVDPFVGDLRFPGMIHGALKFSDHPRARVLRINTEKALNLPGVLGVFTARDIPGQRRTGLITDDWPLMISENEITGYIGDVLAIVAADTEHIAREAASRIEATYDVLEPLTDMTVAETSSIHIHPSGNLLETSVFKRGEDADSVLAGSAFVAEGRFETQRIEHAFLETEAAIARPWENDGLEMFSQGQGVYVERALLARILAMPEEKIKINQVAAGGAFGGKEDLTVQGHAALLAYQLKKTVRVRLTRSESLRMHPKRHPMILDYQLGCDSNGKLTALKARILGDTGAYASVGGKVLERAAGHAAGAYYIPHVDVEAKAVYTNNIPCGAMRGFGVPQATFAIEACMDELCRKGGFQRWDFRYNNALHEGTQTTTGQILGPEAGVRECLLALKDKFLEHPRTGLACGIKNVGVGNGVTDFSIVKIEIAAPERVIIHHGWSEMGQGIHTAAIQTLCQDTGINPAAVEALVSTPNEARSGMTTASRGTSLLGNAVRETAKALKKDLETHTLAELTGKIYTGEWRYEKTTKPGAPGRVITHYSYGYAAQLAVLDETGKIKEIWAAHDVGKALNRVLCESQLEGSVHMGLGYALSEEFPLREGVPVSELLRDLGVIPADETPPVYVRLVEVPDPNGPHGAKGLGEIGLVPTAAAVANAFSWFFKKRYFKLPLK